MANTRVYKSFSTTSDKSTKNGHLYDIDVIEEDIKTLLKTRKNEYPMNTDIGTVANNYIYEPELNDSDKQTIIDDLHTQLINDPRITNVDISIEDFSTGYYVVINATVLPFNTDVNLKINLS